MMAKHKLEAIKSPIIILTIIILGGLIFGCSEEDPIGPANKPPVITLAEPADNSLNQSINIALSWTCSDPDGDPLLFDVHLGTTDEPQCVSSDQQPANYLPMSLQYNTVYYWQIVAKDNQGNSTASPVWNFTTLEALNPDFVADAVDGIAPKTIHFTNTTTGTYQRCEWSFGDGATSEICNPDHTYNSPDCYTVGLTVFDDGNDRFETKTKSDYICLDPLCETVPSNFGTKGPFCPYRKAGDTGFENHRPRIKCEVQLETYNNDTKIRGRFYIWAMEDQPGDNTWGDSTYYVYNLGAYTAPSGYMISIISPNFASYNKVDTDKNWDYQSTSLGIFQVFGETTNEDLCADGIECLPEHDRTKFYFDFNDVTIKICKIY